MKYPPSSDEESDGVPFDLTDVQQRTVMVQAPDTDLDRLSLTRTERELLNVMVVAYDDLQKHRETLSARAHGEAWAHLGGLLVALEIVAVSIDARVQVALWTGRMRR